MVDASVSTIRTSTSPDGDELRSPGRLYPRIAATALQPRNRRSRVDGKEAAGGGGARHSNPTLGEHSFRAACIWQCISSCSILSYKLHASAEVVPRAAAAGAAAGDGLLVGR